MKNSFPIFVVDDDVEDQLMLHDYFLDMKSGESVKYFDHGRKVIAFLEEIENETELPKLIVLDLNMPILNGTQTLLQIKRNPKFKDIPVIIFSTAENRDEKRKCLSYGAIDYVVKPMSYDEGQEIVRKFISFL